jgi:Ran GTPase-activating protein (RanGAP) involved in mRNA processing and transport
MKKFESKDVDRLAAALESGSNTYVRSLSASGHSISPDSLRRLGKAITSNKSKLTSIAIGDSVMGDEGVCAFCDGLGTDGNISLETVDFSYKGMWVWTPSSVSVGLNVSQLTMDCIMFSGSAGMAAIARTLGKSDKLRTLNLSRNEIIGTYFSSVDDQATPIFPLVQELDLSECGIVPDASSGLVSMLSQGSKDRKLKLRLNCNELGTEGVASLSTLLNQTAIVELYLSKCNMGDEGLKYLTGGFVTEKSCGLQILDLSQNNIGPDGLNQLVNQLSEGKASLSKLHDINLAGDKLSGESIQGLAATLGKHWVSGTLMLDTLDLTGTSCGIAGATDIVELCQLKNLRLFNNKLGCEGFLSLAKVLWGGHPTLQNLDLGGNEVKEASNISLLHALTVEASFVNALQVLVVGRNEGGPALEQMVKEVKCVHPEIDIARDKSPTQQDAQNLPPGQNLPPAGTTLSGTIQA